MIEIISGPIRLRRHLPSDLEAIHRWQNDPELLYFNSETESEWSRDQTQEHLERWILSHERRSHSVYFAVCSVPDDVLVGFAAVALIDLLHDRCRLAITLERQYWGRTYGLHTLVGLLAFGFGSLSLHRVVGEVYDFNERAIRLFGRLGFQQEGVMRDNVWKREWRDELIFGMLQAEYDAKKPVLPNTDISVEGVWAGLSKERKSSGARKRGK
jgi:RimJ/RimL family protein N-acetyltransferase